MICCSGGSKSRLAKAAGEAGALFEVEMSKKCAPLWREARFQVKMFKAHHVRTTFGSCHVEKVHAVVARSTFPGQNKMYKAHQSQSTFGSCHVEKVRAVVARSTFPSQKCQKLKGSDPFLTFRCRKSARRCGAKHISKSKCTKHINAGVQNSPCSDHCGSCHVTKGHAVVARSTFPSQKCQKLRTQTEITILFQFLTIERHFVRKGCDRNFKIAILLQFLTIEPHFVRKGCISCRLVGIAPRLKREIEQK